MCVHRARQSSGCARGPWPQRERLGTVKVLTRRKKDRERGTERERERGKENGSGRVGERGERENTSWSFFLPLCNHQWHSPPDPLLSQTNKRPCIPVYSLTGQPASHPVKPHCSHPLKSLIIGVGLCCVVNVCLRMPGRRPLH